MGTTLRVVSEFRRRSARIPEGSIDPLDLASEALRPDAEREQARMRARATTVIRQMSPKLRAVFVLFELDGLTVPEIARELCVPTGTVASRLRRGRAYINEAIRRRVF